MLTPIEMYGIESDSVVYTNPVYDEYLSMVCAYNFTERMAESDLMDAYTQFPASYYLSIFLTLIVFIFAWKTCARLGSKLSRTVRRQLRKSRLPSYWIMICALLDQDQYPNVSRISFSILSFCFSLFFLIAINCFMLNTMSTNLVVIEEPAVVRTYEDAINRKDLRMLFYNGMDEVKFFKNAREGSVESKIWDKRLIVEDMSMELISRLWQPTINQKVVGLVRDWMCLSVANFGLTKTRLMGIDYIRALVTKDQTGKYFTNAFMMHKDAPQVLEDFLASRIKLASQSGIIEWFTKERVPRLFGGGSEIVIDQFVSNKLFLAESPEPEIKLRNVHKLFFVFVTLISLASIVLMFEICKFRVDNSTVRKLLIIIFSTILIIFIHYFSHNLTP